MAAPLHEPSAKCNRRRVSADDGDVVLVGKAVRLVHIDTSSGYDGLAGVAFGGAAFGHEVVCIAEAPEVSHPESYGAFLTAAKEVVVAAALDRQQRVAAIRMLKGSLHIGGAGDLDVVRRHIALRASLINISERVRWSGVVEKALVGRVRGAHLILVVHICAGCVGTGDGRRVVLLHGGAGGGIGRHGLAVVVGKARQRKWRVNMKAALHGAVQRTDARDGIGNRKESLERQRAP